MSTCRSTRILDILESTPRTTSRGATHGTSRRSNSVRTSLRNQKSCGGTLLENVKDSFTPPSYTVNNSPCGTPRRLRPALQHRDSQHAFAHRDQTILVFDWDDTLFPTSWLTQDKRIDITLPLDQQEISRNEYLARRMDLQLLEGRVERVLTAAVASGRVIIVTLASSPWVQIACSNFFPRIGKLLAKHNIRVVYAKTLFDEEGPVDLEDDEAIMSYWTGVKQHAIEREVAAFYAESGSSWKNIVSIGDSNFERIAAQESLETYASSECASPTELGSSAVVPFLSPSTSKSRAPDNYARSGWVDFHYRRVRCKTVKLFGNPGMDELHTELTLLQSWIPFLVQYDGGFDVDIEEDDVLLDFHAKLTGSQLVLE